MASQEKSKFSLWKIFTSAGGFIAFMATVGAWVTPDAGPILWQSLATWINALREWVWSIVSYSLPIPMSLLILGAYVFYWIGFQVARPRPGSIKLPEKRVRKNYKGIDFVIDRDRNQIEALICGKCQAPLVGIPLTFEDIDYLQCTNGHYVGSDVPVEETLAKIEVAKQADEQKFQEIEDEHEAKFKAAYPGLLERFQNKEILEYSEDDIIREYMSSVPARTIGGYYFDPTFVSSRITEKLINEFQEMQIQEDMKKLPVEA